MRSIFLLLLVPVYSFGQLSIIPTKDETTVYLDTVLRVDSVGKSEIYSRAKVWISDYFKSAKAVIDLDDKDNGVIIGKGKSPIVVITQIGDDFHTNCHYTFKISVKDNKARIEVYDLFYKIDKPYYVGGTLIQDTETYPSTWFLPSIGKRMVKTCTAYRDETLKTLNNLVPSISAGINKPVANSDW